jgi:hypothetical protein
VVDVVEDFLVFVEPEFVLIQNQPRVVSDSDATKPSVGLNESLSCLITLDA